MKQNKNNSIIVLLLSIISLPAISQEADFFSLPLPGPATLQVIDFENVDFQPLPNMNPLQRQASFTRSFHSHIESIVDIAFQSRARNPQRWGIFSGYPEEEALIDYLSDQLTSAGVKDIEIKVFEQAPWSITTSWSLQLNGVNGESIELQSAVPMGVGTRDSVDPVTAPLIYVGRGLAADLAGRNVEGKIAIIRGENAPHFYDFASRESMARLSDAGALGVIRLWNTPGNMQVQLSDCPDISCFNLGGEDSAFLEAVLVEAANAGKLDQLSMTLDMTVERDIRQARNLIGKISGSGNSNDNIIIMAHMDTWFSGADDNASGLAVMIGLADYYGQVQPEHDIYFVASPGHHHGAGGAKFLVDNYPDLMANNMLAVNLEHVASTGIARIDGNLMDRVRDQYGNIVPSLSPTNADSPWHGVQMSIKTPFLVDAWREASERNGHIQPANVWEAQRFVPGESTALDVAGLYVVQNVETNHWYHSSGSTPETISEESLRRAFLLYSDFLDLVDQASKAEIQAR
jgi:hypothetical protein